MPQVLEAPAIQDAARRPLVLDDSHSVTAPQGRAIPTAATNRGPLAALRAILSRFTRPKSHPIPTGAETTVKYESALDHVCRVDPYLCSNGLAV